MRRELIGRDARAECGFEELDLLGWGVDRCIRRASFCNFLVSIYITPFYLGKLLLSSICKGQNWGQFLIFGIS